MKEKILDKLKEKINKIDNSKGKKILDLKEDLSLSQRINNLNFKNLINSINLYENKHELIDNLEKYNDFYLKFMCNFQNYVASSKSILEHSCKICKHLFDIKFIREFNSEFDTYYKKTKNVEEVKLIIKLRDYTLHYKVPLVSPMCLDLFSISFNIDKFVNESFPYYSRGIPFPEELISAAIETKNQPTEYKIILYKEDVLIGNWKWGVIKRYIEENEKGINVKSLINKCNDSINDLIDWFLEKIDFYYSIQLKEFYKLEDGILKLQNKLGTL